MAKCDICGKVPTFGHNVSHSMVRTRRTWRPNVQKVLVYENGVPKRLKLCTRCLRTVQRARE
ncbi:MAG TPA: 50S ribosomal protein L28 [Anaerolineae bacterium]|nr:50S ribosomal protein L28 [Anaerolineae bacterium]